MKNSFKKHFAFDFDDTLVDGRQFCGECMARAINKFHSEVNPDLVVAFHESVRGLTLLTFIRERLKSLG